MLILEQVPGLFLSFKNYNESATAGRKKEKKQGFERVGSEAVIRSRCKVPALEPFLRLADLIGDLLGFEQVAPALH